MKIESIQIKCTEKEAVAFMKKRFPNLKPSWKKDEPAQCDYLRWDTIKGRRTCVASWDDGWRSLCIDITDVGKYKDFRLIKG